MLRHRAARLRVARRLRRRASSAPGRALGPSPSPGMSGSPCRRHRRRCSPHHGDDADGDIGRGVGDHDAESDDVDAGDGADADVADGADDGWQCGDQVDESGRVASRPGYPAEPAARSRPFGRVSLAPLARRLAALTAAAGPTRSRQGSTASSAPPPRPPRAGAARPARRSPRLARPDRLRRLRASPRPVAAALRASPVPASPRIGSRTIRRGARRTRAGAPAERVRTSLRTAPCTGVRMTADTAASASGSVLRTTARGSRRTVRHSIAVAAPLRRLRRRRFPKR